MLHPGTGKARGDILRKKYSEVKHSLHKYLILTKFAYPGPETGSPVGGIAGKMIAAIPQKFKLVGAQPEAINGRKNLIPLFQPGKFLRMKSPDPSGEIILETQGVVKVLVGTAGGVQ